MADINASICEKTPAPPDCGRDTRLAYIQELITRGRFVSLREITERFGINMQTARRDITFLADQRLLTKVHGGAIPREAPDALSIEERLHLHDEEKLLIARTAVTLIDDGDVIFLDGGSTTAFLPRLLMGRHLHIVTNAISLANALKSGWPEIDVILTGGYYYPKSELLLGPPAIQSIKQLQVNKAFLSAAGVTADGAFNTNMLVADLEQAVITQAMETMLLVDSSKLDRISLMRVCGLEDIHAILTTGPVSPSLQDAATRQGCRIHLCS